MDSPLNFGRDNNSPLLLTVELPGAATPGKQITLTFDYNGPISSAEDSPTRGVRFASVDKTSAYLLLPARWFPLTDFPSNRYTAPSTSSSPIPSPLPAREKRIRRLRILASALVPRVRSSYVFHCDAARSGRLLRRRQSAILAGLAQGYQFAFYTPPAQASTAAAYGNSLAQIMGYFSDSFGALATPSPALPSRKCPMARSTDIPPRASAD